MFSVDKVALLNERDPLMEEDPILVGLPKRMPFAEYHADEVIQGSLPPGVATLLGAGTSLDGCYQDPPDPGTQQLQSSAQRCRIQLLRYNVPPGGRLLYTCQFHPELGLDPKWNAADPGLGALVANCSQELLVRFFYLSKQYCDAAITTHLPPGHFDSRTLFKPYSLIAPTPLRRPGRLMG